MLITPEKHSRQVVMRKARLKTSAAKSTVILEICERHCKDKKNFSAKPIFEKHCQERNCWEYQCWIYGALKIKRHCLVKHCCPPAADIDASIAFFQWSDEAATRTGGSTLADRDGLRHTWCRTVYKWRTYEEKRAVVAYYRKLINYYYYYYWFESDFASLLKNSSWWEKEEVPNVWYFRWNIHSSASVYVHFFQLPKSSFHQNFQRGASRKKLIFKK